MDTIFPMVRFIPNEVLQLPNMPLAFLVLGQDYPLRARAATFSSNCLLVM